MTDHRRLVRFPSQPVIVQPRPCPPPVVIVRPCPPAPCPPPPCPPPRCEPRRVVVRQSSGISINGGYRGDDWNVGIHIGSGFGGIVRDDCRPRVVETRCETPVYVRPVVYEAPRVIYSPTRVVETVYQPVVQPVIQPVYQPVVQQVVQVPVVQTVVQPVIVQAPSNPLERATNMMQSANRATDYDVAVASLNQHLVENPTDADSRRTLALALLASGRIDAAAEAMRGAYAANTALVADGMDVALFGFDDEELRTLLLRSVTAANSQPSASRWFLVSTLMQAQGRPAQALMALSKAKKLGLESSIADSMSLQLSAETPVGAGN